MEGYDFPFNQHKPHLVIYESTHMTEYQIQDAKIKMKELGYQITKKGRDCICVR